MAKSGVSTRRGSRRSDYIAPPMMRHILAALTSPNRLAMLTALHTGLRICDVLALRTEQVMRTARPTVRELKTGRTRRIYLSVELRQALLAQAGKIWIFEGRLDWRRHRTRQAVAKDLERARKLLRVPRDMVISPHSARKIYAATHRHGALAHRSPEVAALYECSREITAAKLRGRRPDLI